MGPFITKQIAALAIMLAGSTAVFALVLAMNRLAPPPEGPGAGSRTAIMIPVKPKPPKTKKTKPKRERQRRRANTASLKPTLLSSLAGSAFGIPSLDGTEGLGGQDGLGEGGRDLVMTEDAVDEQPKLRHCPQPQYPKRARARGVTGQVVLNLFINRTGEVETVRVLESTPAGVFDDVAVETVKQCRFEPATYQGEPVGIRRNTTIPFDLS